MKINYPFIWRMLLCVAIRICELATYVTIATACMHNNNGATKL